ncbi:MAG: gamma-glutamyl-gamma-aminobutyrate hydrolase [Verrucomicrobiales bacterium]|nr:gamma-glutamyl-gamma-aminobutyrate hydrolase [Verrucomicrobiales bacterium]
MGQRPLILVSSSTQKEGYEFADASISLSNRYSEAIVAAGGIPVIAPCLAAKEIIAGMVARCDGVMLTGGDDIQTSLYAPDLPKKLAEKSGPPEPERDVAELQIIDEVFAQRKPLLAICRGHQILNVALGGTLIVDIPTQVPGALNHRQMERKMEQVHTVTLTPGSHLARVSGKQKLSVNSTHHQAIGQMAGLLKPTATSEDGIVEAMELKDEQMLPFLISVQFHPERLYDRYKEFLALFNAFVGSCAETHSKKV